MDSPVKYFYKDPSGDSKPTSFIAKKQTLFIPQGFKKPTKLIYTYFSVLGLVLMLSGSAYYLDTSQRVTTTKVLAEIVSPSPTESPTPTPEVTATVSPAPKPAVKETKPAPPPAAPVAKTAPNLQLGFPNNKVGIHIYADPADVELAAQLVNTNGGDWGWVSLNYDIKDRSKEKWNMIFGKMKQLHIIPIIQLYNRSKVPDKETTEEAADFLNSVDWPTKHRFITAYNEVNANEYWDGKLDPEGYADVLNFTIDIFKARNPNFFMMNGAFNASARTDTVKTDLGVLTSYLSEDQYLKRMNTRIPGILKKLDGWAAHCYPHPYYSGKPLDWKMPNETAWEAGRDTMSSYKWELKVLQENFGITNLPVFITEAGWPHAEGGPPKGPWHDQNTVAAFYKDVYEKLYFKDNRVVAVTPFILKISPLSNFSWIKEDGTKYPQWDDVVSIPKIKGSPPLN